MKKSIKRSRATKKIRHVAIREKKAEEPVRKIHVRIPNISTQIDEVFRYIEENSPIKESKIPLRIKGHEHFNKHLNILEGNGLIEIQLPLFSKDRLFVSKSKDVNLSSQVVIL
jgi:hypothetical protein